MSVLTRSPSYFFHCKSNIWAIWGNQERRRECCQRRVTQKIYWESILLYTYFLIPAFLLFCFVFCSKAIFICSELMGNFLLSIVKISVTVFVEYLLIVTCSPCSIWLYIFSAPLHILHLYYHFVHCFYTPILPWQNRLVLIHFRNINLVSSTVKQCRTWLWWYVKCLAPFKKLGQLPKMSSSRLTLCPELYVPMLYVNWCG